MAMTMCLFWKAIWNSQNTATLWSKARQSSRSPRNLLEGTLYFAEKVGHWGWWDHLPNFCSIVFYSNKQRVSSSGWGLIWGFFSWSFCEGDWPGCHVAHGKVPWILGLQVRKAAMDSGYDLREGKSQFVILVMAQVFEKAGWWCFWLFGQQFVDISYINLLTRLYFL